MAKSGRPIKYLAIKEQILQMIREGKYKSGDRLPSEQELATIHNVSVITSKKTLDELAKDGHIYRVKGSGSFVADPQQKENREQVRMVAMVLPLGSNTGGGMELFYRVEMIAKRHGYYVSVENTHRSCEKEREILLGLLKDNIKGIIYYPSFSSGNFDLIKKLALDRYPIVIIDKAIHNIEIDTVLCDNYRGSYEMAKHLIRGGHRSIMFACGEDIDEVSSIRDRFLGYSDALSEANIPLNIDLIMHPRADHQHGSERNGIGRFYREVVERLKEDRSITAVQVASDVNAVEIMKQCEKTGIKVPEDVSIAGFDDLDIASYITPPLTTVKQDFGTIGQVAAELLFKRIADRGRKGTQTVIPTELVVRKSCRMMDAEAKKPRAIREKKGPGPMKIPEAT